LWVGTTYRVERRSGGLNNILKNPKNPKSLLSYIDNPFTFTYEDNYMQKGSAYHALLPFIESVDALKFLIFSKRV